MEYDNVLKLGLGLFYTVTFIGLHPIINVNDIVVHDRPVFIGNHSKAKYETIIEPITGTEHRLKRDAYLQAQIPTASTDTTFNISGNITLS